MKGKGCAYAARSQARAFSLRKNVLVFQKHLDSSTRGNPPLAVGGHPGAVGPGSAAGPRSWQGRARGRRGWGAAGGPRPAAPRAGRYRAGVGPAVLAAPSCCRRLQPLGEPCQHRREGPEVADIPRWMRGASLAPCLGAGPATCPVRWQRELQTWAGGAGGSAAAPQQLCQRQSSPPAPRGPCPAQEFLGVLCSPGSFPPSPCLHGNVPSKDFLPKDNPPEQKQTEKVVTNPFWMAVTRLLPAPAPPAICIQKNPENSRLPQHLAQTLRPRLAAGVWAGGRCPRLR